MIKSVLIYIASFTVLFLFGHSLHTNTLNYELRYDLFQVYIFFGVFSLVLSIIFQVLSNIKRVSQQLGFIYLFTLIIKIVCFAIVFNKSILGLVNLTKIESLNILIPLFLFLILEIYFITRLLITDNTTSII